MYHRRINPEKQFINQVIELSDRLDAVETQPTGIVVVREQIKATDENGVQTIFGLQSDGQVGIEPFVYDLEPPPVATVPIVSVEPGVFVISWDGALAGTIPRDFVCVNIIGHKIDGVTTLSSTAVGTIRNPLDISFVSTDVAAIGETWQFSLESEDYRGNKAAWGSRSATVTMLSAVSDSGVNAALAAIQADADAAALAALNAQSTADTAFNNAATAATAAGLAQTTADGKNRIWYLGTAPAGTEHKQDDIWFNTAADNRVSQWNDTANTWDVQLIGNSAILANLDAGKITVGTLLAARIGAKSITTDKLVITSTDNLIVEADFENNGSSWELNANKTIDATGGRGSLPAFKVTGTVAEQTSVNLVNKISVGTEDRFRVSAWVKSSFALVAGAIKINMRCYTTVSSFTNMSPVVVSSPLLVANTWTNISGISSTLPANTIAIEFYISVTNNATGTITYIDYVGATRAADGNLVVDGAIDGKVITGSLIQSDNTPIDTVDSRGVKFGTFGVKAYNVLGQKTFDLSATTGDVSITGKFASGTAEGGEVGSVVRLQMGVLAFGDFDPSPGIIFEYTDPEEVVVTSGVMHYYAGGVMIRNTVPTTAFLPNKNESYLYVNDSGTTLYSSNSGLTDKGFYTNKSYIDNRTNEQEVGQEYTNARLSISAYAYPDSSIETSSNANFVALADNVYPNGIAYAGVGKWLSGSYEYRSQITLKHDGGWYLMSKNTSSVVKTRIETLSPAYQLRLGSESVVMTGGTNAATTNALNHIIIDNTGTFIVSTGSTNYMYVNTTAIGMVGLTAINSESMIHRRAEFTTTNFYVEGGGVSWDTGPAVIDSTATKTKNNNFCQASAISGAIEFTVAGYYSISCLYIANGSPGSGWMKLNHSVAGLQGMDSVIAGAKHEAYICLPDTYFAAGDYIRAVLSLGTAHTGSTRWKVKKSLINN